MEIRYFWIADQVKRRIYKVQWYPGQENLADYLTKHFEAWHHIAVRPWYLHMENSPRLLPRANAPSYMKGCAGTIPNGYVKTIPLPRVECAQYATRTQYARTHNKRDARNV